MTEAVTAAGWLLLHGSPTPPPERIELRAGPVSASFVPELTHLRRIRIGDREILRGIYAAVRDRNWGTIPQRIRITERKIEPDSFRIAFEADAERDDIRFGWRGLISGTKDGTITYTFDGEAKTTFKGNRIGLLALHPPATVCGIEGTATHPDGTITKGRWPALIETDVPFANMASLAYDVAPGVRATLAFEGDTFGMEDQRNWTDDSFKTYSMMHGAALPCAFTAGARIRQSITLRITGTTPAPAPAGRVLLDADPAAPPSSLPVLRPFDPKAAPVRSFEDLSYHRPKAPLPAMIAFSAHPQIHQVDDETIMENAATLATCVRTVRAFAPNARIAVGPLTLNGPGSPPDPRRESLLWAAWTLAAVKALAESGADEAGFAESSGPCGQVLRDVADAKGWRVLPARSTRPLEAVMLLLERNGAHRALVANLTPNPVDLRVVFPGSGGSKTLTLDRYAVTRLDAAR